jgi:hypothetical protein
LARTALAWCALLALGGAAAAQEQITFKQETRGILMIDEQPVKLWELYLGEKKKNFVLLQLGLRFLLLDTASREVFELSPESVVRKKDRATWRMPAGFPESARRADDGAANNPPPTAQRLPSEEWSLRDVGPTRRIRCKLSDEGRVVEVHIPLPLSQRRIF